MNLRPIRKAIRDFEKITTAAAVRKDVREAKKRGVALTADDVKGAAVTWLRGMLAIHTW